MSTEAVFNCKKALVHSKKLDFGCPKLLVRVIQITNFVIRPALSADPGINNIVFGRSSRKTTSWLIFAIRGNESF